MAQTAFATVTTRDPAAVLHDVFGHQRFRGQQEDVVRHVTDGGDAVVLFPTGAGKSACFQIPAICRPGVGIVISPLIALMRDQVEALRQAGVSAAALNSSLSSEESADVRRQLLRGELDLLYVAPERLVTPGFQQMLSGVQIALFAIDEAHCVSQWGHDFRPEYRDLARITELFPGVPRIALTATADPQTRADIIERLGLEDARGVLGQLRPPQHQLFHRRAGQRQKAAARLPRRGTRATAASSIACRAPRSTTSPSWLNDEGIRALPYHAGMDARARSANQDAFLKEDALCLVATVAFGMGIDKPDVRYVAHLDLPVLDRGLLSGDRPRRARWPARRCVDELRHVGRRAAPPDDRRGQRAR